MYSLKQRIDTQENGLRGDMKPWWRHEYGLVTPGSRKPLHESRVWEDVKERPP